MIVRITTEIPNPSADSPESKLDGLWQFHSCKAIDWRNSSDRKWMMNHMHHCMMNGKRVTLSPESN